MDYPFSITPSVFINVYLADSVAGRPLHIYTLPFSIGLDINNNKFQSTVLQSCL
jgi:hypothetical protein